MTIIARIAKKSFIFLLPLAGLSLFYGWKMAAGVLVGGVLALVNLRALGKTSSGLLGAQKAGVKLFFLSTFRLGAFLVVLAALIISRAVNPIGLLAGLTVVFVCITLEGIKEARSAKADEAAPNNPL